MSSSHSFERICGDPWSAIEAMGCCVGRGVCQEEEEDLAQIPAEARLLYLLLNDPGGKIWEDRIERDHVCQR